MTDITFDGSSVEPTCGMRPYRWTDAGLVSGNNIVVLQVGASLYFWNEPKSGSLGQYDYSVDLEDHIAEAYDPFTGDTSRASMAEMQESMLDFSQVNGKLVVVGQYCEPLLIRYDTIEDEMEITEIAVEERDLFGVEDGVAVTVEPEELTNSHEYNLFNRGWSPTNIVEFFNVLGRYPSKNMLHFKGMRKQVDANTADEDATKLFIPAALEAELFQNMSAPQGHAIRNVFNRRNGFLRVLGTQNQQVAIASVSVAWLGNNQWTCTVNTTGAHGVVASDVINVTGLRIKWRKGTGDKINRWYNAPFEVISVIDTNSFTIVIAANNNWKYIENTATGSYVNQNAVTGSVYNEDVSAVPLRTRFAVTAAFAGRIFMSGCNDRRISNRVYFSKLVETDTDVGKFYQEADPTSEFISDLVATDGGYVVLPASGVITGLVPFGHSLIVFSANGVWEIGPGQNGVFSATGYSVKKLADIGCVSSRSIITAASIPMYWGEDGVYAVQQDPNSGYTTAVNMTRDVINGLYNSIRYQEKSRAKGVFDTVRQRAMWLYNSRLTTPTTATAPATGADMVQTTPVTPIGTIDDTDTDETVFDSMLIYDLRLGAWTRWTFGDSVSFAVRDMISMPAAFVTDNQLRVKVFCQKITGTDSDKLTYRICEFNNSTTYDDNGAEAEAFVYSGPDSLGEPERIRSAPYVHVFMRKVDDSSAFMQPRWDWARGHTSGKMGNYMQVYREMRPNPEAYGLVVTKNKVSGRGRNLFLAFKAAAGKPCWIDGWTVKYDANMRI